MWSAVPGVWLTNVGGAAERHDRGQQFVPSVMNHHQDQEGNRHKHSMSGQWVRGRTGSTGHARLPEHSRYDEETGNILIMIFIAGLMSVSILLKVIQLRKWQGSDLNPGCLIANLLPHWGAPVW